MSENPIRPVSQPSIRLTTMAHGGGCASKIPPGELEEVVATLAGQHHPQIGRAHV